MQVCTSLQTDNHASTPPLSFTRWMPFLTPKQQRQSTVTCDKLRAIIMSYLLMLVKVMFLPTVFVRLFASRITQKVMCKNLWTLENRLLILVIKSGIDQLISANYICSNFDMAWHSCAPDWLHKMLLYVPSVMWWNFCNNPRYVRRTTAAVCGLDFDERSSHTSVIRRHYVFLLEKLDLTDLVPELYSEQVLSPVELDDIRAEKTSFTANEKFLSVLSRKSPQQFQQFLDAISKCGQQHVRNVIDAAGQPGLSNCRYYSVSKTLLVRCSHKARLAAIQYVTLQKQQPIQYKMSTKFIKYKILIEI